MGGILYRSISRTTKGGNRMSTLYAVENFGEDEGKFAHNDAYGEPDASTPLDVKEEGPPASGGPPPVPPIVVNVPKFQKGMFDVTASESLLYDPDNSTPATDAAGSTFPDEKRGSNISSPVEVPITPPRNDANAGEVIV